MTTDNELPKKGQVYRHKTFRGALWTVSSCGPERITLKPNLPQLKSYRTYTAGFLHAGWERVR
jgi:hypothetical protein